MLNKRSRATLSGAMTPETQRLPPSPNGCNKPRVSSVFLSPRLFNGFSPKGFSDTFEAAPASAMSPTSILENKPFSSIGNLFFFSDHKQHSKKPPFDNGAPKAIGLAIVGEDEDKVKSSTPQSRMALFGSKLKIQVPSINPSSSSSTPPTEFPNSPIEFGINNRDSRLALFSPQVMAAAASSSSPLVIIGRSISASEVELSEDYTCVITHGPNPRTTHIFDDCVMESAGNEFILTAPAPRKEKSARVPDFLSYCDACKKDLGQGKETFMYRGEKAFCSKECCHQGMLVEEETTKNTN